MTGEAIVMMAIALVSVWGGMVAVTINLAKRGTDKDASSDLAEAE